MLLIHCPYCGLRDEREFHYAGPTGLVRPVGGRPQLWAQYLYWRRCVAGTQFELWLHSSGCQRWLEVQRDLVSNLITAVRDGTPDAGRPA